jgi:hypothetical protein
MSPFHTHLCFLLNQNGNPFDGGGVPYSFGAYNKHCAVLRITQESYIMVLRKLAPNLVPHFTLEH